MELIISGKHMEVPAEVQEYAQRKLGKLSRYLRDLVEAKVEISRENTRSGGDRHVIQVTLVKKGALLRAEERSADIYTAIDAAAHVMRRQIERYKGQHYDKNKGRQPSLSSGLPEVAAEEKGPARLVKTKRFPVKPMSVEEATAQMELLGHDFFLFFDPDEDQFGLLYRRRDGDYGLLRPEMS